MRLWHRVHEEAQKLAERASARIKAIDNEVSELHAKRLLLDSEREALCLATGRLSDFKVSLGSNYLCPYCWMEHHRIAIMTVVGAAEQRVRCRNCEHELSE